MKKTETFEEMAERVREANRILKDLAQLERIIDFLDAYGGNDEHPMQLEMTARFYPDDCLTDPTVEVRECKYEDTSFLLATLMDANLSGILAEYKLQLEREFTKQATGPEEK